MFSNTLTVTIDAVAYSLLRIGEQNGESLYRFRDGVRKIEMKLRQSTELRKGLSTNRHYVVLEHTVFATPTTNEHFYSSAVTLLERDGDDPAILLKTWQGFNTLLLTLDDTFVVGEV